MWGQWQALKRAPNSSVSRGSRNGSSGRSTGDFRTMLCNLGCIACVLLSQGCRGKDVSASAAAPPNVQVVAVIQRDVPVYHEWVATLDGFVNAQIQPHVCSSDACMPGAHGGSQCC